MKLTSEQALALTKHKPGKAREAMKPGNYSGTMTLRASYDMRIGEDYEQTVTASVPWMDITMYLLGQVNAATRKKLVRDFLRESGGGKKVAVDPEVIKAEAAEAIAELASTAKRPCKGKVTGSLHVDVLESSEVAA